DLVALGNQIASPLSGQFSTLRKTYPEAVVTSGPGAGQYIVLSGTSMSAGVVSGASALLLQQNPRPTPDQVKPRLMATSTKTLPARSVTVDTATGKTYRSQYDIFTVGAGYLDILGALSSTSAPAGLALSPTATLQSLSGQVLISADSGTAWLALG